MILRRSRFVHLLPVGQGRTLIVHAISHMRLPADSEISALLEYFSEPRGIPEDCDAMAALFAKPGEPISAGLRDAVERTVMELKSRQILTEMTAEEELAAIGEELSVKHGRDPAEMLESYRRKLKEGAVRIDSEVVKDTHIVIPPGVRKTIRIGKRATIAHIYFPVAGDRVAIDNRPGLYEVVSASFGPMATVRLLNSHGEPISTEQVPPGFLSPA